MKERCFADVSTTECAALKIKNCKKCGFYKPYTQAIKELDGYVPPLHCMDRDKLLSLWKRRRA